MALELDATGAILFLIIFSLMGVAADELTRFIGNAGRFIIAEIYQERAGQFFLLKRKHVPIGSQLFNVGEHQFTVEPEKVRFYNSSHPVLKYDLRDSKAPNMKIKPFDIEFKRESKPSSQTVNLIFRRQGLKQMMMATRAVAMNPIMVGIFAAVAGVAAGVLIMQFWHPGFVNAPPPGYYYEPKPVYTPPANSTVTTR